MMTVMDRHYEIDCRDAFDRRRTIKVRGTGNSVVVQTPPAECATLSIAEAEALCQAIRSACIDAQRVN
ncbi:hypothetical protein D5S17_21680 [Pseudonocardiaceae bacterium YIM PH 21723]|nr:hypothetical protein D5S17_21680 [Pseudonocardiaceae bacterium YIM PH 21723]